MPTAPLNSHQQIVAGDDFKAADGRALTWTSALWPNVAGATLKMVVGHDQPNVWGNLPVTWTGTVSASATGSPVTVSLDVTAAQTVTLPAGEYDYTLEATLADTDVVTLAVGKLTVLAPPGAQPF